jgi:hypothetical protein
MSVYAPIKVPSDNLILSIDSFSDKSYAGQPTTNLGGSVHLGFTGERWAKTTDYPNKGVLPFNLGTDVYRLASGNNYWGYASEFSIQYNKTYTLSYWYWVNTTQNIEWYNTVFGSPTAGGGPYANVSTKITDTFTTTNNTNGWKFGYVSFTTNVAVSSYSYLRGTYTGGSGDTTPTGNVYIANFQLEEKSYPTQYTSGTRSNTQGMRDLTNNYTIDLTNASFNTDAKPYFSESLNSSIMTTLPMSSLPALSNFSLSIWFKPTAYPTVAPSNQYGSVTRVGVLFGATYYAGAALYWYGNSSGNVMTIYGYIRGLDGYRNTSGYNLTLNQYHHLVLVHSYTDTKLRLYVNGSMYSEVQGATASYDSNLMATAGNIGIGKAQVDGGGTQNYSYPSGHADLASVYTKALSSSEILTMYDANRKRYGL